MQSHKPHPTAFSGMTPLEARNAASERIVGAQRNGKLLAAAMICLSFATHAGPAQSTPITFNDLNEQLLRSPISICGECDFQITNNTGRTWTDFHLSLRATDIFGQPATPQLQFASQSYNDMDGIVYEELGGSSTQGTAALNATSSVLDITGLTVAPGAVYSFNVDISWLFRFVPPSTTGHLFGRPTVPRGRGLSPFEPILPINAVARERRLIFTAEPADPLADGWYDPPSASGFIYLLTGGGEFTKVGVPPASFGFGPVALVLGGSILDTLDPGEIFDFSAGGFPGVTEFSITGITPFDTASATLATAFPTFLGFGGTATFLTMTPILIAQTPEPQTIALMAVAVLAFGLGRRGGKPGRKV